MMCQIEHHLKIFCFRELRSLQYEVMMTTEHCCNIIVISEITDYKRLNNK